MHVRGLMGPSHDPSYLAIQWLCPFIWAFFPLRHHLRVPLLRDSGALSGPFRLRAYTEFRPFNRPLAVDGRLVFAANSCREPDSKAAVKTIPNRYQFFFLRVGGRAE